MTTPTGQCPTWGAVLTYYVHDHREDGSGLDDGPPLRAARKRPEPKPPEITANIRARAWATRRAMYGERGHR